MVYSCGAYVPPAENPGMQLGIVMGVLAKHGRDKVTLIASPGIGDVGAWLEQLMAESTGKIGKGLDSRSRASRSGRPDVYGRDRLFAYLELEGEGDAAQQKQVEGARGCRDTPWCASW